MSGSKLFQQKKGFTIIELMIAMVFIGTLMVTVAVLIVHILAIFQKGLTIKNINSTGRALIDDFERAVSASLGVTIEVDFDGDGVINAADAAASHGLYFFKETGTADRNLDGIPDVEKVPVRGAFCTAQFTYVWNSGYVLYDDYGMEEKPYVYIKSKDADGREVVTFQDGIPGETPFHLVKVPDPNRKICENYQYNKNPTDPSNPHKPLAVASAPGASLEVLEMLGQMDGNNLALYDFEVFPAVQHKVTKHVFYSATFILATLRGGVDIMAHGDYCTAPVGNLATDFAYCAVNKFNFSMRATGETKGGV